MEIYAKLINILDTDLSLKDSIANLAQKLENHINANKVEFSYLLIYNDLVKAHRSSILKKISKSKAKLAPFATPAPMMRGVKYGIPMGYLPGFFKKQKNWVRHAKKIQPLDLWLLNLRFDKVASWKYDDMDRFPEVREKMKEMVGEPNFVGSRHENGIRWAIIALGLIPKVRYEQSLTEQIDKIEKKILLKKIQIDKNEDLLAKAIELKERIEKSY